jgi:hypothetical protein
MLSDDDIAYISVFMLAGAVPFVLKNSDGNSDSHRVFPVKLVDRITLNMKNTKIRISKSLLRAATNSWPKHCSNQIVSCIFQTSSGLILMVTGSFRTVVYPAISQ